MIKGSAGGQQSQKDGARKFREKHGPVQKEGRK